MEPQGDFVDAAGVQAIFAEVIEPHAATADGAQLELFPGEVIQVVERDSSGWWGGLKSGGLRGWFPASAVRELHPKDLRIRNAEGASKATAAPDPVHTATQATHYTTSVRKTETASSRVSCAKPTDDRNSRKERSPRRPTTVQKQHVQQQQQLTQQHQHPQHQVPKQQHQEQHQQPEQHNQQHTSPEMESSPGRQFAAEAAAEEAAQAIAQSTTVQIHLSAVQPPGADGHLPSKSSMIATPKKEGHLGTASGPCAASSMPSPEARDDCVESASEAARQLAVAEAELSRANEERREAYTERREALEALTEARGWASRAETEAITAELQIDRAERAAARANSEYSEARSEAQRAQKEACSLRHERTSLLEELEEARSRCELLERCAALRRQPCMRGMPGDPEEVAADRRTMGRSTRTATTRGQQALDAAFDSTEVSLQRVESERQALLQRLHKEEQRYAQAQKTNQRLVNEKTCATVRGAPTPSRTGAGRHVADRSAVRSSVGYDVGMRITPQRTGGRTPPPNNRTPPQVSRTPPPGNRTPPAPGSPTQRTRTGAGASAALSPRGTGGYPSRCLDRGGAETRIKSPRRQPASSTGVDSSPRRIVKTPNLADQRKKSTHLALISTQQQSYRDQPLAAFGADHVEVMPTTLQTSGLATDVGEILEASGTSASDKGPLPPRPTASPPRALRQVRDTDYLDGDDEGDEEGLVGTFVFGMSPLARTPSFADGGGSPVTPRSARSPESPMEPLQEESSILHLKVVKTAESQVLDEEALTVRIAKVKGATSPMVTDARAAAGG